ncbi:MAG TPA: hypothetical protein VFN35_09260 [Ktedonobacteraceae bacterium]|nr:hypothetical protein [Ktedonobacteraceae bacterium]
MVQTLMQTKQTGLDVYDSGLDGATRQLIAQLNRVGVRDGAQRLELLRLEFQNFSVADAYRILRPEDIRAELEEAHIRKLNTWHVFRNVLSIAPILVTWFTLALAAISYQQDLANPLYKNDIYQPFLWLWQEGFHGIDPIPFSTAAFIDVFLLMGLILLVILLPFWEGNVERGSQRVLADLQDVSARLFLIIGKGGSSANLVDSDIDKITEALKRTFERVMLGQDQLAREAKTLAAQFRDDLTTFNRDLKGLTSHIQGIGTNLKNYDQKLQDFADASVILAGGASNLAQNAKDIAVSASMSAQASQNIGNQLSSLNMVQNELVKTQQQVATTIRQTQKEVAIEISNVAGEVKESNKDTREAGRELERVAQGLGQITRADLQVMTNQVTSAADQVDRLATNLLKIDAQLQQTTQALAATAQALNSATVKKRGFMARFLRSPWLAINSHK